MKDYKDELIKYIDLLSEYHLRVVLAFVKRIIDNH